MASVVTRPDKAADPAVISAPAKLNLNLRITGKRDDGYHLVDSVVVFTGFGDRLTITSIRQDEPEQDSLTVAGPFAAAMPADDDDNICLQAVRAFRAADGGFAPVRIHLDKQIPVGAGLGGGSADAAAILRHLNRHSLTPLAPDALWKVALSIGADVPVCLDGRACRMTGIGETLDVIDPAPTGHVVLARPNISLSTARVFANLSLPSGCPQAAFPEHADTRGLVAAGNDLTGAAIGLAPVIGDLLSAITACKGCLAAQMSGSGSACFGLFHDAPEASAAANRLAADGYWAVATRF